MTIRTNTAMASSPRFSFHTIISSTTTVLFLLATSLQLSPLAAVEDPEPRIVGGNDADFNEYPFFTSWGRSCGASLIHDDILLTAAHCNPVTTQQVIVGAYAKDQAMRNSETRNIMRRILHPEYNVDSWNYDIMLLKIDQPVTNIEKVALNNNDAVPATLSTVTPLGLGRMAEVDGAFPKVLQEVNVRVYDNESCNASPMYPGWIQDSMLCAGVVGGGQDACFGDSGGPLLQKNRETGEILQVGIVSFGTGCARRYKPGVYHRVSKSYDWIQDMICEHSENPPLTCPGVREALLEQEQKEKEALQQQQEQEQLQQLQDQLQELQQQVEHQQQHDQHLQEQMQQQQPEPEPEPEPEVFELFTHPEEFPPLPLGMCEGDCDSDEDCAEGLICFFKRNGVVVDVPGCEGSDTTGTDFCVDAKYGDNDEPEPEPEPEVFHLFTHPENPPPVVLGMCEGDCDSDADCAEGLFCLFKTLGIKQDVPGCEGSDSTSTDFCVDIKYRGNAGINPSNPIRQSAFTAKTSLRGSTEKTKAFGSKKRNRAYGLLDGLQERYIP